MLLLALLQPTLQQVQHAQNEVHSIRKSRLRYVEMIFGIPFVTHSQLYIEDLGFFCYVKLSLAMR